MLCSNESMIGGRRLRSGLLPVTKKPKSSGGRREERIGNGREECVVYGLVGQSLREADFGSILLLLLSLNFTFLLPLPMVGEKDNNNNNNNNNNNGEI